MGSSSGLIVAGIAGATAIGISFAAIPFLTPALRRVCIPYVPATPPQLKNVSRALAEHVPKPSPLIDLGSGDGRVNLLYDNMLEVPSEEDRREEHIAQMDEKFFNECDNELTKINLFFSQKIAEAQGKYHELQTDLQMFKEAIQTRTEPTTLRRRFGARDKLHKETAKTSQQLKLAFSEFYLSLVLVQNFQQLNATGFRKILKKHDKLTGNERGLDWRINKVEKSSFFLNREIETLINNVETSVINELEGGNRQAGMKRLKVLQCASEGITSTGVELNGILVAYSKYRAARVGLRRKAKFHKMDIFKTELEPFNTAVIFGAENLMTDMVPKLSEMRSGTSIMRGLLSALIPSVALQRNRATYYKTKKGFVPTFVRRFFLRHPQSPFWIVLGLLCTATLGPSLIPVYYFITLSPEEFKRYSIERKALVMERAKYGKSLWIPFYSSGELNKEDSQ
ncbi:hypothetical protein GCK32_014551 [Trichostrongylus colubriformis]|uniref:SPX domain-containing protein n=1 Tax=Trichostrongylus colubriformis TaxID=6319 RepID=A0AAN8FUZ3_TRICO